MSCCRLEIVEHERDLQRVARPQPAAQHGRLPGEQIDEHGCCLLARACARPSAATAMRMPRSETMAMAISSGLAPSAAPRTIGRHDRGCAVAEVRSQRLGQTCRTWRPFTQSADGRGTASSRPCWSRSSAARRRTPPVRRVRTGRRGNTLPSITGLKPRRRRSAKVARLTPASTATCASSRSRRPAGLRSSPASRWRRAPDAVQHLACRVRVPSARSAICTAGPLSTIAL